MTSTVTPFALGMHR